MGITIEALNSLHRVILNPKDLDLIELGIQESVDRSIGFHYLRDHIGQKFKSYISLDLHNVGGATIFDLSEQNPKAFSVDIITNIGTSEHVEYEQGQYNCWFNMHSWLKLNGLMIHEIPEKGSWANHCRYYSTFEFFKEFEKFGYEIVELDNHKHPSNGNLNWAVLKKVKKQKFMDFERFFSLMYMDKSVSMGVINHLNNPKNLT